MTVECRGDEMPGLPTVVSLSVEEQAFVEQDFRQKDQLCIGSLSEILVLSALTKRCEAIDTEGSLQIFDMVDVDGNGILTREELRSGVRKPAVRAFVERTKNVTLKGLFNKKQRFFDKVFDTLDVSGNGVITKDDFIQFVKGMALERLRYMRVIGLLRQRCFWGRGLLQDDDDDEKQKIRAKRASQRCTPRGYWADFWFYAKNNHPLLALFLRDEAHPFSRRDALGAELIKQCYCLCASVVVDRLEDDWFTTRGFIYNWILATVFISLPSMVLEEVLFYLLACPCLRFERRGRQRESCLAVVEKTGDCCGRLFIVLPLALTALGLVAYAVYLFALNPRDHSQFALVWLFGLVSEYLMTWPCLHLVVHFNFLYPDCKHVPCAKGCFHGCCGIWDFLNCGRWATERRLALELALTGDDDLLYDDLTFL